MRRRLAQLAVSSAAFVLVLVFSELALRAAGFSYRIDIDRVEFGWPDPETRDDLFEPDPDLFWIPRDYRRTLRGLHETSVDLLFLGDSVVASGLHPQELARRFWRQPETRRISTARLGVGGWSSYQGLESLRRDILDTRPGVVLVSFGWNDHWYGWGVADSELHALRDSWLRRVGAERLSQLLLKARLGLRELRGLRVEQRVPVADFALNLREMVRLGRDQGSEIVLLTAPTPIERGAEPAYLSERWLHDLDSLVPLHESYVAAVREVGEREGATVCDLHADFLELLQQSPEQAYFMADAIHFEPIGSRVAAGLIYECLRRHGTLDRLIERSSSRSSQG